VPVVTVTPRDPEDNLTTTSPVRRGKFIARVGLEVDLRQVAAVGEAARAADGVLDEPVVRVADLGQDDIGLEVTFWTDSSRPDSRTPLGPAFGRLL